MYESTAPFKDTFDQAGGTGEVAQLRGFAWAELVARLAAARDLRRVLEKAGDRRGGSFVGAADAVLGSHTEPDPNHEGSINLVGLSGSKTTPAFCADAVSDAAHVDREAL